MTRKHRSNKCYNHDCMLYSAYIRQRKKWVKIGWYATKCQLFSLQQDGGNIEQPKITRIIPDEIPDFLRDRYPGFFQGG